MNPRKRSVVLYEGERVVLATSEPSVIAAVVAALGGRLDRWREKDPIVVPIVPIVPNHEDEQ